MELQDSMGVNYKFIDLIDEEIILFRNKKVFRINSTMLLLLGKEADSYVGQPVGNLVKTSFDLMDMIKNIKSYQENKYTGVLTKHYGEKLFINFSVTLLDEITYMLIINGKQEKEYNSTCCRDYSNQELNMESFTWGLNAAWDSIYIHDEYERIIFVNKSGVRLAGLGSCKEIVGKKLNDIMRIHPDSIEEIRKRREIGIRTGAAALPSCEQKLIRHDGSVVIAEISAVSYLNNGSKNVMLIARDITEKEQAVENRIRLEETIQYDKLKTEFFSNISHEFRTPLNIILGTLQLIDMLHTNGKCDYLNMFNSYFKMMRQNCYRLLRLVNNLIDINRIDSDFLNINLANNDIVCEVEDICQSVAEYADMNGIDILFDTDVEEKIMAYDSDKIEKIMLNLLSNAIKFNQAGGRIDINIYDKQQSVIISVMDSGIGIPEDKREKIFDRFMQVDNLFTREAEGSGIGLSLVKALVQAHGGSIMVESELNKGSNFIVELPVNIISEGDIKETEYQFAAQDKIERITIELSDIYPIVQ